MGTGRASGPNRAEEAAQMAISSPLLEDCSIDGATGVLINITGGPDFGLHEIHQASSLIQDAADEDANIIFGTVVEEGMHDEVKITVIATGFPGPEQAQRTGRAMAGARRDHMEPDEIVFSELEEEDPPALQVATTRRHTPTAPMRAAQQPEEVRVSRRTATFVPNGGPAHETESDEMEEPTFLRKLRQSKKGW
jgi:cell division protein FtsZ